MDPFSTGSDGTKGDKVNMAELAGKSVLFIPREHIEEIHVTPQGPGDDGKRDPVSTDLVVFGGKEVEHYERVLILQGSLIGPLKRDADFNHKHGTDPNTGYPKMRLAKLGRESDKSNAAFTLSDVDDKTKQAARDWIAENFKSESPF